MVPDAPLSSETTQFSKHSWSACLYSVVFR